MDYNTRMNAPKIAKELNVNSDKVASSYEHFNYWYEFEDIRKPGY